MTTSAGSAATPGMFKCDCLWQGLPVLTAGASSSTCSFAWICFHTHARVPHLVVFANRHTLSSHTLCCVPHRRCVLIPCCHALHGSSGGRLAGGVWTGALHPAVEPAQQGRILQLLVHYMIDIDRRSRCSRCAPAVLHTCACNAAQC